MQINSAVFSVTNVFVATYILAFQTSELDAIKCQLLLVGLAIALTSYVLWIWINDILSFVQQAM
jgi:hypothetical protein